MPEREKARTRAQGAFDNFLTLMVKEINHKSENYKEEFWDAMDLAVEDALLNRRIS